MFGVTAIKKMVKKEMSAERLNELIETYGTTVMRISYMYLKDKLHAEDVSQEVFIKLFKLNKSFENREHEKAWIIRVTINLCKDHLRSFWQKRISYGYESKAAAQDVEEQVLKRNDNNELFKKVLSLSEAFKTVIILYYYEGYSTKEIASILDTPDATIRSRLKRARDKLKLEIKGDEYEI